MNIAKGYLTNNVMFSEDRTHIFDMLNGNVLTGHILVLQVSQIFSIDKERANKLVTDWFIEQHLTEEEIINFFTMLEFIIYKDGSGAQFKLESFKIEHKHKTIKIPFVGYSEQICRIQESPRVHLKLSTDKNNFESINSIINSALVGEKFESTLFDNRNNMCYSLIGCLVGQVTHDLDEVAVEIICDLYEPIMAE